MKRFLLTFVFSVILSVPFPSFGFVPQIEINELGRIVSVAWRSSEARNGIQFFVNTSSFLAWENIDTADLRFINGGSGNFRKSSTDRRNVVLYDPSGVEIGAPAGSGVIAITTINWDEQGRVTDADITFNGRDFTFSVTEAFPGPGPVDLQDVMTHEVGHLIGLDHTPLVGPTSIRPTMNPFASQDQPGMARTLEPDDVAGATALYPGSAATRLGAITGQVMNRNGSSAFGVHVIAYDATTGNFVVSALSGAAGDNKGRTGDGRYEISGLPPGEYRIGIESVQGSVYAQNFGGIFSRFETGFDDEFFNNVDRLSIAQVLTVEAGRLIGPIDFVLGLTTPGFPQFTNLQLPVNTPDRRGPYKVRLSISDEGTVVSSVLRYQVNGSGFVDIAMTNDLGNVWNAEIPGSPPGAKVDYQIVATDDDGNVTAFPPDEENPLSFDVIAMTGEPVIYVVMTGSSILSVLDSGNGKEVARIETGDTPHSAVITPDEEIIFVANTGFGGQTSRNVTAIATATHERLATINVGFGPLDMAISPFGDRVYVTNSDSRSLSVIGVDELREVSLINLNGIADGPFGLAVSPDGRTLYATDIGAAQIYVVDSDVGTVTDRIDVLDSPRSVVVSPDGRFLYVAGFEGGIGVVNLAEGRETQRISTPAGVFRLALSPDGSTLYATDQDGGNLLVVDTAQNRLVRTIPVLPNGSNTRGLTVSEDGRRIYVANSNSNDLVVFDSETLSVIESYNLGDGPRGIVIRIRSFVESLPASTIALSDFDSDGLVGFSDFLLFAQAFGTSSSDTNFDPRFDLNDSGTVDFADFLSFAQAFGESSLN